MTDHPLHGHPHTHEDQATPDFDFNLAYAPFCAYAPAYSCPLPPMEDWLHMRIEAGERNPLRG